MVHYASGATPAFRQVMFFIDGAYLRKSLMEIQGNDEFDLLRFPYRLAGLFIKGRLSPEIIRTYFYGAICDPHESEYKKQKIYYDTLNKIAGVEVKLGNLVKTKNGFRQKGVDILIAIDVLTKAYQNHYDIAILICGDRDIIPLIKAVKDSTGKRIYGILFKDHYSMELENEYDNFFVIEKGNAKKLLTGTRK